MASLAVVSTSGQKGNNQDVETQITQQISSRMRKRLSATCGGIQSRSDHGQHGTNRRKADLRHYFRIADNPRRIVGFCCRAVGCGVRYANRVDWKPEGNSLIVIQGTR